MSESIHVYTNKKPTPSYLAKLQAEISQLSSLKGIYACPTALSFLKVEEKSVLTALADKELGIQEVTFTWTFKILSDKVHTKTFIKVPVAEYARLNLSRAGVGSLSLDEKFYYLADWESDWFYRARREEGTSVNNLKKVSVKKNPHEQMVHVSSLDDGSMKIVAGKIIVLKRR